MESFILKLYLQVLIQDVRAIKYTDQRECTHYSLQTSIAEHTNFPLNVYIPLARSACVKDIHCMSGKYFSMFNIIIFHSAKLK